jgi:TonB-linked SusC/RagA family outer membrane protein
VKTKRASGQQMKLSYNGFVTKQEATAIPERVSAIDHMLLSNEAERNRTGNPNAFVFPQTLIDRYRTTPANNLDVIDTDWLKEVLTNTGLMQNHNVQLNAGGERMSLFGSFSYLSQQGLIPNSAFNKYDLRLNPEFKVSKKLTLIGVLAYTNSITTNPSTGSAEFIIRQAIGLPAIGGGKYGPGMYGTAAQSNNRNPIAMAEATGNSVVNNNILLTRFGFNFHPIAGLEIEGYWGRQTSNPYTKSWVTNANIYQPNLASSSYSLIGTWPGTTSLSEAWNNNIYTTYLGQATYTKRLGNHTFKFLAGGQSELFTNNFFGASRQGFINPNQPYLSLGSGIRDNNAGADELALAGFFARFNYSYKDKYFLELNGRRDGSSRFSQALDKQWGNFGSISAAWVFSKEKFMESLDKDIVFGKLRASLGGNGNQNIGNSFYVFDAFYQQAGYTNPASSPNLNTNSYFGNVTNLGLALLQFSNPQLGWETSKQWNIGLDLTLAKNFTFTADYYVKTQKDLLLRRTLPASAGGLTNPFVNAGNMENRGWEFTVNYKNRFGKLGVDITAMVSDVKNQVTSLVPGTPFIGDGIRTAPGQAAGSYFGYVTAGYFSDSTEIKAAPVQFGIPWNVSPLVGPKPGDVRYTDLNKDGKVDGDDRTFIGNAFPRYEYSININLNYGNWDLNIFGQGVGQRNNFLSGTGAVPFNSADFAASLLSIHKNYWRPDNENALFPRLLPSGSGGNNYLLATQWIRSAAYFRIKNINLGYTLPQSVLSKTKISNFRIYFSCANLLTLSNAWKGFDPEINSANAEFYPLMRTFTGGINVTF